MYSDTLNQHENKRPYLLGILGGTFDPLHYGHIKPALVAKQALNIDKLLMLPAHIPPHKYKTTATAQQRSSMVAKFCQSNTDFILDERELRKNSPSYTVETLAELKAAYPNTQLFFFIGMDSLLTFHQWHQHQDILKLCHLVVSARPNYEDAHIGHNTHSLLEQHKVDNIEQAIAHEHGAILMLDQQQVDISSSEIRQALQQGENWKKHVPPEVCEYINDHKLYR